MLNVEHLRADFPILNQEVKDHPLVYFDNAATTQKPQAVIDAVTDFLSPQFSQVKKPALLDKKRSPNPLVAPLQLMIQSRNYSAMWVQSYV